MPLLKDHRNFAIKISKSITARSLKLSRQRILSSLAGKKYFFQLLPFEDLDIES